MVTVVILFPVVWYLEDESRFFESLFIVLSYFHLFVVFVFYGMVMCLYLLLFYLYERKQYLVFHLKKITENVQQLARGEQFSGTISEKEEFQSLARGIEQIMTRAEQAIEDVKKAEQTKSELITNVAHDLRSPLTSIIGYLDLINEDRYRDEVELRYYIQVIHDKTASLHGLINDIFDYTYVQNQQVILKQDQIDIEEMINQLVVQTRIQVEEANMELRQVSSAENPIIKGDGGKLVRVFENLIQNAIRYGEEGTFIDISINDTEKIVEVAITNYGQVIPNVDIPHISERFYRVEKSRSHFTGGSGLGLAIAKGIMDLHRGTIEVESANGRTTFTVMLSKE